MAEACQYFAWTPEQVLASPAIRFFALMRAARKLRAEQEAFRMVQLCDVASIPLGDSKYYQEVRGLFLRRAQGKEEKPRPAMDPTDPTTVELISNLFMEASRFH